MKKIVFMFIMSLFVLLSGGIMTKADDVWEKIEVNDSKKVWTIDFNTKLNGDTINGETVMIYEIDSNDINEHPVSVKLLDDKTTVSVKPLEAYKEDKVYFLLITTGVFSQDNNRVKENVRRKFTYSEKEEANIEPENKVTYIGNGIEDMNYQEGEYRNSYSYDFNGKEVQDNVGNIYDNFLTMGIDRYSGETHGWNYLEFPTLGKYKYFKADIALTETYKSTSDTLDFNIYADDELVFNKKGKAGDFPESIVVDIKEANKVKFRLNSEGNANSEIALFNPRFTTSKEYSTNTKPIKEYEYPNVAYLSESISYMNYQEGEYRNGIHTGYQSTKVSDNIGNEYDHYVSLFVDRFSGKDDGWNYVDYPLENNYDTFTTTLGLTSKYKNTTDNMTFTILGDGSELYKTTLANGDMPENVKLDVSGVEKLRFHMKTDGNSDSQLALFNPTLK